MKLFFTRNLCLGLLLLLLSVVPAWSASYNLGSKSALQSYVSNIMNGSGGTFNDVVNGQSISWQVIPFSITDISINGGPVITVGSTAEAFDAIYSVIASSMAVGSVSSPNSPSQVTSRLVFDNLVLPSVKTATELRLENEQKAKGGVRTFGAVLRGEFVKANDNNGAIYGFNLGLAYDRDKYTFGVMVPYDRIDIGSLEGNRAGMIAFGQYHLTPLKDWEVSLSGNINYMFTQLDYGSGSDDNLHTYGAGASAALRYMKERYELGSGVSYQYNRSDNITTDNDQHLLKLGLNGGYRITPDNVLSAHASWTCDVTSYTYKPDNDNYFEVGTEYRTNLSDTWSLSLGYKKVLGMSNYRSDLVYIGTLTQF
jgi:hypothetical protein